MLEHDLQLSDSEDSDGEQVSPPLGGPSPAGATSGLSCVLTCPLFFPGPPALTVNG